MFEFKNVKFKNILNIENLKIVEGKIITLVGDSGGGKTSILKMLNKIISPTEGEIFFKGKNLNEIDSVMHRRTVSMLSQAPIIFEGSIKENLTIGLNYQEKPIPEDAFLEEMMKKVKLNKKLTEDANNLSGGEKQRLGLGRVLLLDAPIYLMDEPSAALDDYTEEFIIGMITNHIRERSKSLIMVTHSKNIANKYSDNIIRVKNGECIESEDKL